MRRIAYVCSAPRCPLGNAVSASGGTCLACGAELRAIGEMVRADDSGAVLVELAPVTPPEPHADDLERLVCLVLAEPDDEGDCLRCHRTMASPDRSEGEEATPLCHACAQAALPMLALEVRRLRAAERKA